MSAAALTDLVCPCGCMGNVPSRPSDHPGPPHAHLVPGQPRPPVSRRQFSLAAKAFYSLRAFRERSWGAYHRTTAGLASYSHEQLVRLSKRDDGCNPAHLEAVTQQENLRRQTEARTTCPAGHPWDEKNTYRQVSGARQCRTCHRNHVAAAKARKRAEAGR